MVRTFDAKTGRTTFEVKIKPDEADVVRWIYAEVLAGRSTVEITRDLNARGVATRNGSQWYPSTVRNFIYSRYYIGEAGYGKYQRVLPQRRRDPLITHRRRPKTSQVARGRDEWLGIATVPAIIEPDVQGRAQAILKSNQRRRVRPDAPEYALRGLLRCAVSQHDSDEACGYSLAGHAQKRKDGSVRRFYRCVRRNLRPRPGEPLTCSNQLPGPETDELVWDAVIGALKRTPDLRAALARLQETPAQQRRQWQEAIARLEAERAQLRKSLQTQQRLLEEGHYTPLEYEVARGDILPQRRSFTLISGTVSGVLAPTCCDPPSPDRLSVPGGVCAMARRLAPS